MQGEYESDKQVDIALCRVKSPKRTLDFVWCHIDHGICRLSMFYVDLLSSLFDDVYNNN